MRARRILGWLALVLVVVAGGLLGWEWYVKRGGGPTKPPPVVWERQVPGGARVTGPTLGASPDGRWFALAWAEGRRVWYMRGTTVNGLLQLDAPTAVADSAHPFAAFDEDPPKAAVDNQGQVAIAWMTRPLSHSDGSVIAVARPDLDRDGSLSLTRLEPPDPKAFLLCEALQYDDDGRLLALWIDAGRSADSRGEVGTIEAAAASPQGPFERITTLADSVCACCRTALAWLGPDRIALAYRGTDAQNVRDLRFAVVEERGSSGAVPPRIEQGSRAVPRHDGWKLDGCPSQGPGVAAAGENAAWIAWYTEGAPRGLYLARVARAGGTTGPWTTEQTLVVSPAPEAAHPSVATLSSGRPVVVFDAPIPGADQGRALFARVLGRDGLSPPVEFARATRVTRPAPLRWGRNGLLLAWQSGDATGSRVALAEWKGL